MHKAASVLNDIYKFSSLGADFVLLRGREDGSLAEHGLLPVMTLDCVQFRTFIGRVDRFVREGKDLKDEFGGR